MVSVKRDDCVTEMLYEVIRSPPSFSASLWKFVMMSRAARSKPSVFSLVACRLRVSLERVRRSHVAGAPVAVSTACTENESVLVRSTVKSWSWSGSSM